MAYGSHTALVPEVRRDSRGCLASRRHWEPHLPHVGLRTLAPSSVWCGVPRIVALTCGNGVKYGALRTRHVDTLPSNPPPMPLPLAAWRERVTRVRERRSGIG